VLPLAREGTPGTFLGHQAVRPLRTAAIRAALAMAV
jgi:hypothetical protein